MPLYKPLNIFFFRSKENWTHILLLNYNKSTMNFLVGLHSTQDIFIILHQEIEKKNDLFVTHQTIEIHVRINCFSLILHEDLTYKRLIFLNI